MASSTVSNQPRQSHAEMHDDEHGEEHQEDFMNLVDEVGQSVQKYCSSRPGVVAGVLFGLGFFCGWKLRPW